MDTATQTNQPKVLSEEQIVQEAERIFNHINDSLMSLANEMTLHNAAVYTAFINHLANMGVPEDALQEMTNKFYEHKVVLRVAEG